MTHSPDGASTLIEAAIADALSDELADGGAGVPYGVIAERVAAQVVDAIYPALRALSPSPGLGGEEVHLAPNVRGQEPRSSVLTSTPCQSEEDAVSAFLRELKEAASPERGKAITIWGAAAQDLLDDLAMRGIR